MNNPEVPGEDRLLPRVVPAVIDALRRDIEDNPNFLLDFTHTLVGENRDLSHALLLLAAEYGEGELGKINQLLMMGGVVYLCLRNQEVADRLNARLFPTQDNQEGLNDHR